MKPTLELENLSKDHLKDVIEFVTSKRMIRASDLQKKFLWGYNRADHAMHALYKLKIISEPKGLAIRYVLKNKDEALKTIEE